jgi:hypothetical protein
MMQYLKKNYEKVLFAVVVIAALGIVAFLPIMVSREKQDLEEMANRSMPRNKKPLPPLDLSKVDALLKRGGSSATLDLATDHKLFNPVRWQMKADHTIFPNPTGKEIEKLEITKISPLYEVYSLESVSATPGLATHYGISVKHEAAALASQRAPKVTYVEMNQLTNNFTVIAAEGATDEDPGTVTLLFADTQEKVSITKDKPYKRVEGYTADLYYQPENHRFAGRRKTDASPIYFGGEYYKIVDIKESEVVLLQQSNQKQWIKELNPTTSTSPAP